MAWIYGIILILFGPLQMIQGKIFGKIREFWIFLPETEMDLRHPVQAFNVYPPQARFCHVMTYLIGGLWDVQFGLYFYWLCLVSQYLIKANVLSPNRRCFQSNWAPYHHMFSLKNQMFEIFLTIITMSLVCLFVIGVSFVKKSDWF